MEHTALLTILFLAQTSAPVTCAAAGSTIRVNARTSGYKPVEVTYVVNNRRRDTLRWIRISVVSPLAVDTAPQSLKMPLDWRAAIEPAADGRSVNAAWTAIGDDATIAPHGAASFRLRGAQRYVFRPGDSAIDFTSLPFSAGDDAGHCWSGITTSEEYSSMGLTAGITGGAARMLSDHGTTRVLLDFPAGEVHGRLSDHVFFVVPLALTWGIKGGFSVDGSIGIGLTMQPTKYLGLSAKTNIGTALFNNVTHLRTAGIDFNIPIARSTFAQGLSPQTRFLVVGVEVFERDVSKLAGFLDGPQWYASGRGVALRIGIKNVSWSRGP